MKRVPFILLVMLLQLGGGQRGFADGLERCRVMLPEGSGQAVVVGRDGSVPSGMALRLYERGSDGWEQVGAPIPVVVGRNGLAPVGKKREGDGRTPSGVFALERGFGYEPLATKITYIVLTREMIWVDDPRSDRYNTLTDREKGKGLSYEVMKRGDDLYKYGIVVEYNTKKTIPGAGSAIFLHLWAGPTTPTAGCVAMAEPDMLRLLGWLDPARQPVALIGDACP
ncbi:MAG TPA: L,D-transpeptidase family protein [Desulfuromonadaceae bacterium]